MGFSFSKILSILTLIFLSVICFAQNTDKPIHFDHLTINEGLSHNTVFCMLQDYHGYIWIGTQNGLNKYDGYRFEVYRSFDSKNTYKGFVGKTISCLFEDSQQNLWVGTRKNGINIRKKYSDQFINLQSNADFSAIEGFDIASFYEDTEGNIWIATIGAGILKYNPTTKFSQHFTRENSGLSNNDVFDIIADNNGIIWVGTAGSGLNYLTNENQFAQSNIDIPNTPNLDSYRKTFLLDEDFLWIGTEGTGLYRMDTRTKTYTHFGIENVKANVIRDLHKNNEDKIYIASDGGGLSIYDKKTASFLNYDYKSYEPTGLNSNALYSFLEDQTNNIWIGTFNGGINIQKKNKTWFDHYTPNSNALNHRSILAIHQSRDGKIWLGSDGGGLNRLDQSNNQLSNAFFQQYVGDSNSIAGNVVKTIHEDQQGNLWIGIYGMGVDKYNPTTNTFTHYKIEYGNPNMIAGNIVWSIAEKSDGRIFFATLDAGLNIYNPTTDQFTSYQSDQTNPNSIAANSIMVVFVDTNDLLWIGTAEKGLNIWEEATGHFKHYQHDPENVHSLSNNEVRAIFQDSQGQIWIGTEGGGLNRWLGDGKFEHISTKDGLIANSVMGITEDEEGDIWVSTFEGISKIAPNKKDIFNFSFRTKQNINQFNQMAIAKAANGELFFGGINGLHAIHPSEVKEKENSSKIIFIDFKIYNKSTPVGELVDGRTILEKSIEDVETVQLNYTDNSISIQFAKVDYRSPLEHIFSYKMEGFDSEWQSTISGQNIVSYTNLDPGAYTFKVKHQTDQTQLSINIQPPFWKTIWFRLLMAILLIGFIVYALQFLINRQEAIHKRQLLEAESKILQLENEKLEEEVNTQNSKLMYSAVQMAHKNEILNNIKQELKEGKKDSNKELRSLLRTLDRELMGEDYWKEFNLYFNQVDNNFVKVLLKEHPKLTQNDIRICTLMRIQLSTKEIASLLNISSRGVEQSRYRLKKRLNLKSGEDLSKYISTFNS